MPKRCPFHYRELECKSRKSRSTWSNRQIWSWSTEWSRAKVNRVLPREHTGHSKHPLPTQEKTLHMDITRWSTLKSDWLYSLQPKMEKLLYSQQKQDQELTVAQIMNPLLPNSDLNWSVLPFGSQVILSGFRSTWWSFPSCVASLIPHNCNSFKVKT